MSRGTYSDSWSHEKAWKVDTVNWSIMKDLALSCETANLKQPGLHSRETGNLRHHYLITTNWRDDFGEGREPIIRWGAPAVQTDKDFLNSTGGQNPQNGMLSLAANQPETQ